MKYIYSIIKADYLQRTRSYGFLITLAITIYAAYSFVPPPNASYTTLSMPGYKGVYNSAWVGYVSGMMTAIMLSLYGFFLVIGGIKKDIETEVGLIIATTQMSNFTYLLSKFLSNFLVLLTIAGCTFAVSIAMFFIRTNGYPFVIVNFVLPYLLFAIPALLTISAVAIVIEVFLGKRAILQYILFFFLFGALMANINGKGNDKIAVFIDPFGVRTMTNNLKNTVNTKYHESIEGVSLGFTFHGKKENPFKTFEWNGVKFSGFFLSSRLVWMMFAFAIVYFSSFFFHRFDFKQSLKKRKRTAVIESRADVVLITTINRAELPAVVADYSIFPFIKTELLLLIRKGPKWFWFINGGLWLSMLFVPFNIAHSYLLPVLWFLQVTRWSEITTKEKTNRLHYFTYSSFKPLQRMLPAQLLAGIIMAVALALPLIIRSFIIIDFYAVINILNGALFVVLLAAGLGIASGGKKLYEIIFFLVTYLVIDKLPVLDYLGSMPHNNQPAYITIVIMLNIFLAAVCFGVRNYQVRHL